MKNITFQIFIAMFIFLFSSRFSVAQERSFVPLEKKYSNDENLSKNYSELAYISARCSAIYSLTSGYFSENGTTQEDKDNAKNSRDIGEIFLNYSIVISLSLINMSEAALKRRMEYLLSIYSDTMKRNKSISNNAFEGVIADDLRFCSAKINFFLNLNK